MHASFPTSLQEIAAWSKAEGVRLDEGRVRFVQYVVLSLIAHDGKCRRILVLKGGNALRLIYHSRRSTKDLDFSIDGKIEDNVDAVRTTLNNAFRAVLDRHGVKVRCQRCERNPPGPLATHPTYQASAAFQLPGDRWFVDFESRANVPTVVDLEISIGDLVCESEGVPLTIPTPVELRVCTLNDIIAEKLRSLLQQKIRRRTRHQDVFDIARFLAKSPERIDPKKVATYLKEKCAIRGISPTKASFDEEVRTRAATDYERLKLATGGEFIPFDIAWTEVLSFVQSLDLS